MTNFTFLVGNVSFVLFETRAFPGLLWSICNHCCVCQDTWSRKIEKSRHFSSVFYLLHNWTNYKYFPFVMLKNWTPDLSYPRELISHGNVYTAFSLVENGEKNEIWKQEIIQKQLYFLLNKSLQHFIFRNDTDWGFKSCFLLKWNLKIFRNSKY